MWEQPTNGELNLHVQQTIRLQIWFHPTFQIYSFIQYGWINHPFPRQFCEASATYHKGSSAWGWRPSATVSNWWFNKWHYIWTSRVPQQTQYLLEWGLRVCSKNCVLIKNPCYLQKPPSGCLLQKGERNEALLQQPYHLYKKAWCDQMSKKPKPKHMT